MQIKLIAIGKTDDKAIEGLTTIYTDRLKRYVKFDFQVIPDLKNRSKLSQQQQKQQEGELILKQLKPSDFAVLLDENGKE